MMRIGNHLGASFEIWNEPHAWFWLVTNCSRGAAIGVASTEAEALGEARCAIEEMAAPRPDGYRCEQLPKPRSMQLRQVVCSSDRRSCCAF